MGLSTLDKTYYFVNFDNYKISLIVLDNYDVPDTLLGDGNFAVSRGVEAFSQAQIDWFISTLNNIPADYTVVVARHSGSGGTWETYDCNFTKPNSHISRSVEYYSSQPINDIINAWQKGMTLTQSYTSSNTYLPTISVNCDFSSRGEGKFACYLFGHSHCDTIAYDNYGNLAVQFDTASSGNSQPGNSDLPRINKEKTEDCITVVSIDTYNKLVKLVRIGSNISMSMQKRDFIALPFQKI
jgi:hypothetical protein